MIVEKNKSLKHLNTFGFDALASYYAAPTTEDEAKQAIKEFASKMPVLLLGGGSNLLFVNNFKGLVLHPQMSNIDKINEDENHVWLQVGAGVVWDNFVAYAVEHGLGGIENLSLIPGNVGASAVQNIGAYGSEVKDTIAFAEGFMIDDLSDFKIDNNTCEFAYRDSIFKNKLKGKAVITNVVYKLNKQPQLNISYGNLAEEASKFGDLNLQNVRQAVINIRQSKLPNPAVVGNAGSFFKNPVVTNQKAEQLKADYSNMPIYPAGEGLSKLAAGKLIELCGFKGKRFGNVGVHENQALVLVNLGCGKASEIAELAATIQNEVKQKFGVNIEPEVNYVL